MSGKAKRTIVSAKKQDSFQNFWVFQTGIFRPCCLVALAFGLLLAAMPALARQTPPAPEAAASPQQAEQHPALQTAPQIHGRIVDQTGVAIAGAKVKLSSEGQSQSQEAQSNGDGQFSFANAAPGPFHLTVTMDGFTKQEFSGTLTSAESYTVPQIVLAVAPVNTEVRVVPPQIEVAEEQIKEQEQQRALGFIPNFYVTYIPNAAPLVPRQKFELAWKSMRDPVTFGLTGAIAGLQQAQNDFSGYGQGAQGYAKRYAAAYGDMATSTLIGSAILPSLLKQDPRYFYKGTGSKRSRLLYAIANSVICKGDNGHWQANYSAIIGGLASGGISNLYYPAKDREGAELTIENTLIGIGATAAANILQEFVIRRLTPSATNHAPANGGSGGKAANPIARVFGKIVREGD
jgi:Carboxypeptidase regulatory-like domain